jgi:glutamate-5-semialdehyde dehydrogenase
MTGTVLAAAARARDAAARLAMLPTAARDTALEAMADAIEARGDDILDANATDLVAADGMVAAGTLSRSARQRLSLDRHKLETIVEGVRQVRGLPDPVGRTTLATELDEGLVLRRITCPIGVLGVIFESRPDALPQIASLAIKSGNAALLKGGSEARRTNRALFAALLDGLASAALPDCLLTLLEGREQVSELLSAERLVDLIIPRGSKALVTYVQEHTSIPVLGHADGVCHVYVDRAADLAMALDILIDAKTQYPAVCNAAETLLVHHDIAGEFLPLAVANLVKRGVEVRCAEADRREFGPGDSVEASDEDWSTEYGEPIISVRSVPSLEAAIEHINRYGSHHTEAIVTEDDAAWRQFRAQVDSAGVFRNASTRFADGFRYGFGAEVGISTGRLHPRGPVGLDGLVTYKYELEGRGHVVAAYVGPKARPFTHKKLEAED